ncbi:MAG: M20 family metallopeptidase [Acidobacteriia bacterium]|nr:M20 family metallopeptidase [Terriglobia bacterium]
MNLIEYFRGQREQLVGMIGELVKMESPSDDKAAIDRLVDWLSRKFRSIGVTSKVHHVRGYGNHLRLGAGRGRRQVFVLGHTDTVWPGGTLKMLPFTIEGNRARGPGIFDMKASIAAFYFALKAIRDLELETPRRIVALFDSDEEVGSHSSRSLILSEARKSDHVLVLEPSISPHGGLKTARKGVGVFRLRVRGVAAHAGIAHEAGVNAIEELSRQVLRLQAMTNRRLGTSVNVGLITGGTRSNVVPAEAEIEIDVRVKTAREGERLTRRIYGLRPLNPGAKLEISGGINRPPLERTARIAALFRRAEAIGRELGLRLSEGATGGGSDGNFTAALGVPTLDGLGVIGDGAHSVDEFIQLDRLPERVALLTRLLTME